MIDNREMDELLAILENMEDEERSARLLKELNDKTKKLSELILNKDPDLGHEEWKQACDAAQAQVDDIIDTIKSAT